MVPVVEGLSDRGGLSDESEDLHFATASSTSQGVDFVDAVDELGPSFVRGTSSWSRLGFVIGTNLDSVGLSNAIGLSAVEMNQVLFGLGGVDEHSS